LKKYNILFVCEHNSARSIIAEIVANTHISKKFVGYSAGYIPSEHVNPFALEIAQECGYPLEKLFNKGWQDYASFEAPRMDFIIDLCQNKNYSERPYWPGNPISASWGFEDPAIIQGSDELKRRVFKSVKVEIQRRLDIVASLPIDSLNQKTFELMAKNYLPE
jgi:protein-tyrosine-phosphatase